MDYKRHKKNNDVWSDDRASFLEEDCCDDNNEIMTFEERFLLMISFILEQNISYKGIGDLIRIMGLQKEDEIKSAYFLRDWLKKFSAKPVIYFLCPSKDCEAFYKDEVLPDECNNCKSALVRSALSRHGHYFLYIPIKDLLKQFLEIQDNEECIYNFITKVQSQPDDGNIKDIVNSDGYKEISKAFCNIEIENLMQPREYAFLTFLFNLDGVETSKSSSCSLYPLFLNLVEMAPTIRKTSIFAPFLFLKNREKGIYFRDHFLAPFIEEVKQLSSEGFLWKSSLFRTECITRLIPFCLNCDSVMKPDLNGMTTHSGYSSCPKCTMRGYGIRTSAGGNKISRIPNFDSSCSIVDYPVRSEENLCVNKDGQKFLPTLMHLPNFDIFSCCSIDAMHGVDQGVFRKLFTMLFTETSAKCYVGKQGYRIASEVMLKIKGVSFITRGPRAMSESQMWKASEWKNWGYFYSIPIVEALVKNEFLGASYFENWVHLMTGLSLLNSVCISPSDILRAKQCLEQFQVGFLSLYGEDQFSSNIHLIWHLPDSVKYLGPMWSTSLYQYESFNRVLLNSFRTGSQGLLLQIAERCQMRSCYVQLYSGMLKELGTDQSVSLKVWKNKMNPQDIVSRKPVSVLEFNKVEIFKRPYFDDVKAVVKQHVTQSHTSSIEFFDRVVAKGVTFTTYSYKSHLTDKKKQDCYFYSDKWNSFGRIDKIIRIGETYLAIFKKFILSSDNSDSVPLNFDRIPYMKRFTQTAINHSIIPLLDISRKCLLMYFSDG